jgi:hypothetical protein
MNSNMHFQYYNSSALVVVNTKGQIRTLYTPFRVICVEAAATIPKGTYVYVEEVISNDRDQLQYIISGQLYRYSLFQLCIKF